MTSDKSQKATEGRTKSQKANRKKVKEDRQTEKSTKKQAAEPSKHQSTKPPDTEDDDLPKEFLKRRSEHWDEFQRYVESLDDDARFEVQKANSQHYLESYNLTVKDLKERLAGLERNGNSRLEPLIDFVKWSKGLNKDVFGGHWRALAHALQISCSNRLLVSKKLALSYVPPYSILAEGQAFENWRRGWDSNPRGRFHALAVFKTAAFNRSATSPLVGPLAQHAHHARRSGRMPALQRRRPGPPARRALPSLRACSLPSGCSLR